MLQRFRYSFSGVRARALAAGFSAAGTAREGGGGSGAERDASLELFAFGSDLGRHLPSSGQALFGAWLLRFDLENLKVLCRALMRRTPFEDVHPLLIDIPGRGPLSPERLRAVGAWDALAALLRHTPFEGVLPLPREQGERPLFRLETSLERAFWRHLCEALKRLPFSDRAAAREILSRRADLDRYAVVWRGVALGLEARDVLASLPPLGTLFSPGEMGTGFSAEKLASLARRGGMPETTDHRRGAGECHLWRRLHDLLERRLRAPPFTLAPSLSALFLKEIELRDWRVTRDAARLNGLGQTPEFCLIRRRG